MRHFAPYDFAADHPNLKNLMGMRGQDVCGCANMGAVVALRVSVPTPRKLRRRCQVPKFALKKHII